ncbi:MAG: methyltransferase domain-containing protein, partial [Nitriliruptorales bacterium]
AGNVEFLKGYIEEVPLPDASVDVVISNCVINLSDDKPAVFAELVRVVKPGGRLGISDVVADDALSAEERQARGSHVGCIAGALSFAEHREALSAAGFEDVTVTSTHEVTDGMHAAIVRATRIRQPCPTLRRPTSHGSGGCDRTDRTRGGRGRRHRAPGGLRCRSGDTGP